MTKKLPGRRSKRVVADGESGVTPPADDALPGRSESGAAEQRKDAAPPGGALPPTSAASELPSAVPALPPRRRRVVSMGPAYATSGMLTSGTATSEISSAGNGAAGALARASIPLVATPMARALVVDDDPEIRRALARLLKPELDVHLAGSVAQAEALLERLDRVDVAFIDWELPDGTGEQILERLAHWPDAIRVLISARASASENLLSNRALANLVLGKPLALPVIEALKRAALALPHG